MVMPNGDAVDLVQMRRLKVVVAIQLPVCGGFHRDISVLTAHAHAGHGPDVTHAGRIHRIMKLVVTDLPVFRPAVDVICRSADQDSSVRGDRQHLIVLSAEGEELTGQVLLENMSLKLGAQETVLSALLLGDVAGVLQVFQQCALEPLVGNMVIRLHAAGINRELSLCLDDTDVKDESLIPIRAVQQFTPLFVHVTGADGLTAAAEIVPEVFQQLLRIDVDQQQLAPDISLCHIAGAHAQAQAEGHIARGSGVVGDDVGNRLGVCVEQAVIIGHVILQQVLRRDNIDKALRGGTGGKIPLDLEHVAGFILHRQVAVFLLLHVPEIGGDLKDLIHELLTGGEIGIVQQVVIILLRDPPDIHHRECVAAVPGGLGDLVF